MNYMKDMTPLKFGMDNAKKWYEVIRLKELSGELNEPISSDDIFKFMMCWIAFNSLYDANFKQKKFRQDEMLSELSKNYEDNELNDAYENLNLLKDGKVKTYVEKFQILYYLSSIIERLTTFGYDKLVDNCDVIKSNPVLNGTQDPSKEKEDSNRRLNEKTKKAKNIYKYITKENKCSEKIRITYLIMTIYQVRCNLFHGSKKPDYERDEKLVYESSVIMERVLRVIFSMEKNKSIYDFFKDKINEFTKEKCKSRSNWGGAGLIISDKEDQKIINFQKSNPEMTYVINPNAKYVIWLINLLKPYANIDYIDKYEYYYRIGNTANNYFAKNGGNEYSDEDIKKMLNAILKEVKEYFE